MAKISVELEDNEIQRITGNPSDVWDFIKQSGINQIGRQAEESITFSEPYHPTAEPVADAMPMPSSYRYAPPTRKAPAATSQTVESYSEPAVEAEININKQTVVQELIINGDNKEIDYTTQPNAPYRFKEWINGSSTLGLSIGCDNMLYTYEKIDTSTPEKNLSPKNNKRCKLNLHSKLSNHEFDAINIKSHNTHLEFKEGGKLINRCNKKGTNPHPDCIQLIPFDGQQFTGGMLQNVSISGETKNQHHIDSSTDPFLQGILASDGRFKNLQLSCLSLNTSHPIGIHINGMLSGALDDIDLHGEATIKLYPIRLGGHANIFIESVTDEDLEFLGQDVLYEDVIPDLSSIRFFNEGTYLSIDCRHIGNDETKDRFIADKAPTRIYRNFPLNKFYSEAFRNPMFDPRGDRKTDFIRACDEFAANNGAMGFNEIPQVRY